MKLIQSSLLLIIALSIAASGCTDLPARKAEYKCDIIATGAQIRNSNGIMFDDRDQLYVASVYGGEIIIVDPLTGNITGHLGIDEGVKCPDDLVFGPDGSLYFTNLAVGEVGRLSADGISSNQSVGAGVNSITFSDDGRLFTGLVFMDDKLYELDPSFNTSPRLIASDLGGLNAMDWGSDGYLYGPVWTKGEVVRIDVDSGEITTVADGFSVPSSVKFDSSGNLYVADYDRGEIIRLDMVNNSSELVAGKGLERIDNMAFDSEDNLFASAKDGTVVEVMENGTTRVVLEGGMIAPGGVAVMENNQTGNDSVFIADLAYLRELDGQTGEQLHVDRQLMTYIDNSGDSPSGGITAPVTVAPDGENLIVSSWIYNLIQIWDPQEHRVVREYPNFSVPLNAISFQGDLIVAELGTEAGAAGITKVNDSGRSSICKNVVVPVGLASTDIDLWVSDWYTGMVLQLAKDGHMLSEAVPVVSGLSFPEGLAVDTDGNLLVVETGTGKLLKIDVNTGNVSTVAVDLETGAETIPGMTPNYIFNGVAVSPAGTIYVTGDVSNVLYRIEAV